MMNLTKTLTKAATLRRFGWGYWSGCIARHVCAVLCNAVVRMPDMKTKVCDGVRINDPAKQVRGQAASFGSAIKIRSTKEICQ